MTRFLAYTSPARGHLYPLTPTLHELVRRGHDVHVRTLASELDALEGLGVHAGAISPGIEALPLADWQGSSFEESLALDLDVFRQRSRIEISDLRRAMEQVDPDVLIVDTTTPGAIAVAEASGKPWAQFMPFLQTLYLWSAPVPGAMDLVNERRREVGLGPVTGDGDQFRAPIYLYFTAPPLHPPEAELPSAWRALGPALWEPEFETPSWLDEIGNPIVFVAISSEYQRDDELVRTAFDSMRDEDVTVVVSTAAHDPDSFDVPANGRVARWLPHGAIVPRAACVVCHGGMGITQKALAAGVPVCVVPYERDQSAVAERVRSIGAGAVVARSDLSADALRAAVKDATAMGEGARRVADAFARIDGTRAAADELEALTERSVIGV